MKRPENKWKTKLILINSQYIEKEKKMLEASNRMKMGEEIFTDSYSEHIPEGEHKGIFDEQSPGEEFAPKKEKPKTTEIIKTNFVDDIMVMSGVKQFAYHMIFAAVSVILFYLLARLTNFVYVTFLPYGIRATSKSFFAVTAYMAKHSPGMLLFISCISIFAGAEAAQKYKEKARRMKGDTDERHKDRYTSAGWLNDDTQELINTMEIVYPEYEDAPFLMRALARAGLASIQDRYKPTYKPVGIPLCIYEDKLYCMPDDPKHWQFKNKNIAIVGISGGGKSFTAIKPMLMSSLSAGNSILVTDTKGDLFQEMNTLCEALDYNVKVFDVKDAAYSDCWNCLKDIVNASEGTVWDKVNVIADTIIQNTGYGHGSSNQNDYWTQNEQNLLRALLFYICRSKSCKFPRNMQGLMQALDMTALEIDAMFKELPEHDPAFRTSSSYRNQSDARLKDNYRSGLASKLALFDTPEICGMLSYDGIDFEAAVHEKTIIFLITPDSNGTYDVITSLFVTCMYNSLIEISDSPEYGGSLLRPFWFLLDELCNMASINELSRKISTNRSRNINMVFAIQSIPQMDNQYYKLARNILAQCGTQMLFGTNDADTAKYYAERCGKVHIVSKKDTEEKPPFALHLATIFSRKRMQSRETVDLWPAYKVEQMGNEMLLAIATKEVMKGTPFPATSHPLYRDAERIPMKREPEWYKQYLADDPSRKMPEGKVFTPSEYEKQQEAPVYSVREYEERKNAALKDPVIIEENAPKASMKMFEADPYTKKAFERRENPAQANKEAESISYTEDIHSQKNSAFNKMSTQELENPAGSYWKETDNNEEYNNNESTISPAADSERDVISDILNTRR